MKEDKFELWTDGICYGGLTWLEVVDAAAKRMVKYPNTRILISRTSDGMEMLIFDPPN